LQDKNNYEEDGDDVMTEDEENDTYFVPNFLVY